MVLINCKMLLIDINIKDINVIIESLQEDVSYIIINYNNDTFDTLKNKINDLNISSFDHCGLIREQYFGQYYKLLNIQENSILLNVNELDPELNTWIEIIEFMSYLKNTFYMKTFNFISCRLELYPDYKYIFNKLNSLLEITIGRSENNIGNIKYGGNWILSSSNFDIKDTYFTDNIFNYIGVFGTFNISLSTSGVINYGNPVKLNYDLIPNVNTYFNQVNTISGILSLSGQVVKVFFNSLLNGFSIGYNSIKITYDGGSSWYAVNSPSNTQYIDLYSRDLSNCLVITTSRILKTINGGNLWYDISGVNNTLNTINFNNEIGFIGCTNGYIYRSTNYGNTWTYIYNTSSQINKIFIYSKLNIYFSTSNNYLYYTLNGGITFSNMNIGLTITNIHFSNDYTMYITANNSIYKSINYGTFTSIYSNSISTLASLIIANNIIMASTTLSSNIIVSLDYGNTFNILTISASINQLILNNYSIYGVSKNNNLYRIYMYKLYILRI